MGVAATLRYQAGHGSPGNGPDGLNQHLEVIAVRKVPLNLAGGIGGKRAEHFQFVAGGSGHKWCPFGGRLYQSVKPGTHRSVISVTSECDVVETLRFATGGIRSKVKRGRFFARKPALLGGNVTKVQTMVTRDLARLLSGVTLGRDSHHGVGTASRITFGLWSVVPR